MRQLRVHSILLVLLTIAAACSPAAQPSPTSAPAAAPTSAPLAVPTATLAPAPTASKPAAAPVPTASGASISISGPLSDEAKSLNGAGSTFAAPLYQKWFDEYNKVTQVQVNYQAIGSGGGIQGIQDQTIDFGATDAPMSDAQLQAAKGGPLFHIPTALGGIVPIYNIPNVSTKLKFTGDTLAGIYLGDISKWNDPKLVADNPDLAQVNQDIVTVHRSDGSGTTFGLTDYLSTSAPTGSRRSARAPPSTGRRGLGGSGSPGVAGEMQQTPYSIGYVELIYALQNNLAYGQVKNKAGQWIDASLDSVTAAAGASLTSIPADLRFSIVNAPGDASYPDLDRHLAARLSRTTPTAAKGTAIARLTWWATHDGQKFNKDLQYSVVPDATDRQKRAVHQTDDRQRQARPRRASSRRPWPLSRRRHPAHA